MSWTSIDVDGRRMWERNDGVRASHWQQIEAIEKAESESLRRSMDRLYTYQDDEPDEQEGESHPWYPVIAMAVVVVLFLIDRWLGN